MSADWQVGDLAVCVAEVRGDIPSAWHPEIGGVYTIVGIAPAYDGDILLELEEDPNKFDPEGAWDGPAFRKIRPDEHEACEEEFVTLLKRKRVSA